MCPCRAPSTWSTEIVNPLAALALARPLPEIVGVQPFDVVPLVQ